MKKKGYVEFILNPEIDTCLGSVGLVTIPSKKEDYKPIRDKCYIKTNGIEKVLENIYIKKPSSNSVKEFKNLIQDQIIRNGNYEKILKPKLVEVFISITINREKYFLIDVDNMAKTVLDSIKGYLFEDDNQVKRLIIDKQENKNKNNLNYLFICVTELTENRNGALGQFKLFEYNE